MLGVKVDAFKERAGKELAYLLEATSDVVAALNPRSRPTSISIHFSPKQAYWKEERDRIEERGVYHVATLQYSPSRSQATLERNRPWSAEQWPQVVDASVMALPRRVLPPESASDPVRSAAPEGCARDCRPGRAPCSRQERPVAWIVDVEYDAPARVPRALLKPLERGRVRGSQRARSQA